MTKIKIDRNEYDHPEHFDDIIRTYQSSERYVPTPLEQLLFELSGHKCAICREPWLEIHHIEELGKGGQTEYENLIVLCPNCHTRVHKTGIPSKAELLHYKRKQEIAYELPILSRLSSEERIFIKELSVLSIEQMIIFSRRNHQEIDATDQDEATKSARKNVGLFYLQECGILAVDLDLAITLARGDKVSVTLQVRLTSKGIKWISYLKETNNVLVK